MTTTYNYSTQRVTAPTVFVTKGRQRVKQYGNTIYIKNGDEFEIELFNPTTNKVLAKISLNGKNLGSGIVLRPGERVFLERYFDEAKKFLFETYEVNGADPNAKEAIKMNGIVDVEFYNQYSSSGITWISGYVYQPHIYTNPVVNPSPSYFYTSTAPSTISSTQIGGTYTCSCNNVNEAKAYVDAAPIQDFAPLETGRVEKGSNSDQSFSYDSTTFNTYYSWKTTWTILPESQRVFTKEDLNVYCVGCGKKRRKISDAFCSKCGSKF